MKSTKRVLVFSTVILAMVMLFGPMQVLAAEADVYVPSMYATAWSLIQPVIAI